MLALFWGVNMLKNKNILVIGKTGGIGEACSSVLKNHGANVFSTTRNKNTLADEYFLDCGDENSFKNLSDFFIKNSILLDGIINCAGIHRSGPLVGMNEEDIEDQLNINLKSNIWLFKYFLPQMISKRSGSIVLLGSVSAHRMTRGHAVYSATKAGLEGLIKSTAAEVAKRNIRINGILPGPVMTKMLKDSIDENGVDPTSMIPMGRLINPEEIAQVSSFLLSDLSSAMTGTLIPVDAGYLLW